MNWNLDKLIKLLSAVIIDITKSIISYIQLQQLIQLHVDGNYPVGLPRQPPNRQYTTVP